MGLLYTGSRLFPIACVEGYKRVPEPPAKRIPLYPLSLENCFIINLLFAGCSRRIMRFYPLPVTAAGHVANPGFVFQVPAHRLAYSTLERLPRIPSQLALNFTCIHSVAPVVPRTVFHERDQFAARIAAGSRQFIDDVADGFHDLDVALLVPAANVIRLSNLSPSQNRGNRLAVILYIKPVAHILAIAINWQRLAVACVQNHQRN